MGLTEKNVSRKELEQSQKDYITTNTLRKSKITVVNLL